MACIRVWQPLWLELHPCLQYAFLALESVKNYSKNILTMNSRKSIYSEVQETKKSEVKQTKIAKVSVCQAVMWKYIVKAFRIIQIRYEFQKQRFASSMFIIYIHMEITNKF